MPDISLPVSNGDLAEGFCPQTEQQRLNGYVQALQVLFPFNLGIINTGNSAPSADNRIYPWYRSNGDGTPDKWYTYSNGSWISPHPIAASDPSNRFYRAAAATIDTYDGGESAAVTTTTGPMWEIDTTMSGLIPVGVSGDFAFDSTGGEIEHTLVTDELPEHQHIVPIGTNEVGTAATVIAPPVYGYASGSARRATQAAGLFTAFPLSSITGAGDPHENMPPYRAGLWIRRTARAFYRI